MLLKRERKVIVYSVSPILIIKVVEKNRILGKMTCIINEEIKGITISDIVCKKNNKGYGSLMMIKLIEIANEKQYEYIDGWLSKTDCDHEDRLCHFYQKFGFEIILYDEGMKFADIKLQL